MDLIDVLKTMFLSNHGNNYYNVVPCELNNSHVTYYRLIATLFSKQIANNLDFYINEIIIKIS